MSVSCLHGGLLIMTHCLVLQAVVFLGNFKLSLEES